MTKLCKDGTPDMRQFNTGRPRKDRSVAKKKKGGCFKWILVLLILVVIVVAICLFAN